MREGFAGLRTLRRGMVRAVGAATLVALVCCCVGATAASAHVPRLVFKEGNGSPYVGTEAYVDVSIGENGGLKSTEPFTCFVHGKGPFRNGVSLDNIVPDELNGSECFEEAFSKLATKYSITGHVTHESVSWTGAVAIGGKFTITQPGPCIYTFEHLAATQQQFSSTMFNDYGIGQAHGYITRGSNLACTPTEIEPLVTFVLNEAFGNTEGELQY